MTHHVKVAAKRSLETRPSRRPTLPIVTVRDKLERAFRNAQSAHLDQQDLHALIKSGVFEFISTVAAKEIAKCLEDEAHRPFGPAHSGSNGEKIAKFGKSPGMTGEGPDEHAASAASRRALLAVEQVKVRRRKL